MNANDEFLELITEFQGRLFGFVLSMLGDVDQANEVLQETNLVLWRKSGDFQPGTDFKAWSFRVAHFQAMAFRQRQVRDRLVFEMRRWSELLKMPASWMKALTAAWNNLKNVSPSCLNETKKSSVGSIKW